MKNNKRAFTAIELLFVGQIVLVLAMAIAWIVNLIKLVNCDFAAPYKGEVVHAVGIIPPAALVTVWFSADK